MQFRVLLGTLVALAAAPAALADTIRVPSPGIPTIQAAVDWALPGDVILVGPGEYADPVVIFDRTGIEIRGAGWPVLAEGGGISIDQSSEIVLRGLNFAGANVGAVDSTDVHLVGNRFHDAPGFVVDVSSCDGLMVSRCQFRGIAGNAVECEDATGLVVERCLFQDIGFFAVYIDSSFTGSDGVVFAKNRVLHALGGITCGGEDLVVEDNRMAGLAGLGISAAAAGSDARGIYRRNRIQTAAMFAIENDGIDSIFEKNTLVGGGIGAYGPGARVLGNRVTAAVEEGIYVFGTASVERNQVRGAAAEGIAVVGDGTAVVGNTTTGTGGAGLLVAASNCRVSKNRMTGLGDVGFVVDGTGNLVTENRVSGSVALDLADTAAEGANTYIDNRFRTVDFDYVF